MARSRMIKPEFFDDEKLSECSVRARLLFIGLWVNSDDYGVVKGNPKWIKAQVFPYDDFTAKNIQEDLDSLQQLQCIVPFNVNGEHYYYIRNWNKYQKVNRPSKENRNPEPPQEILNSTHDILNESSMSPHGSLMSETETETETETKSTISSSSIQNNGIPLKRIFQTWNDYKQANNANVPALKDIKQGTQRYKHTRARWNSNPDIATWEQAIDKAMRSAFLNGNNQRGWTVDFDWIVKSEDNFTKVLEGKYDDHSSNFNSTEPIT